MKINGRNIGYVDRPYVIAEMSCNHGGDISSAFALIRDAVDSGCDAIKFQCYEPRSLTIDCGLKIESGAWAGTDLHKLYEQAQTPMDWMPPLFDFAAAQGITAFASVYCLEGLAMLERCDCPAYKIASFEACHYELLEAVGKTKKPTIVSLGVSDDGEILEAIATLTTNGCPSVCLLHCTSSYPATGLELSRINDLKRWLNGRALIGYSDHTAAGLSAIAVAAGACVLERHIKTSDVKSADYAFSSDYEEMRVYVYGARLAHEAMYNAVESTEAHLKRSVRAIADIKAGERLTRSNVAVLRPNGGLHPRLFEVALGSEALCDVERGEAITKDNVDIIGVC